MPFVLFSTEDSAESCQARCAATEGCEHFVFWTPAGSCHLQDANATATLAGQDSVGGPRMCPQQAASASRVITVKKFLGRPGGFGTILASRAVTGTLSSLAACAVAAVAMVGLLQAASRSGPGSSLRPRRRGGAAALLAEEDEACRDAAAPGEVEEEEEDERQGELSKEEAEPPSAGHARGAEFELPRSSWRSRTMRGILGSRSSEARDSSMFLGNPGAPGAGVRYEPLLA